MLPGIMQDVYIGLLADAASPLHDFFERTSAVISVQTKTDVLVTSSPTLTSYGMTGDNFLVDVFAQGV